MNINLIDQFFLSQEEPQKGCFLALRKIILDWNPLITEHRKYKLPFYYYQNKPFCYLWKDKNSNEPYIGMVRCNNVDYPQLIQGNRKKMKVLPIDPTLDIEITLMYEIFEELKKNY